jgi:hypothetical protein
MYACLTYFPWGTIRCEACGPQCGPARPGSPFSDVLRIQGRRTWRIDGSWRPPERSPPGSGECEQGQCCATPARAVSVHDVEAKRPHARADAPHGRIMDMKRPSVGRFPAQGRPRRALRVYRTDLAHAGPACGRFAGILYRFSLRFAGILYRFSPLRVYCTELEAENRCKSVQNTRNGAKPCTPKSEKPIRLFMVLCGWFHTAAPVAGWRPDGMGPKSGVGLRVWLVRVVGCVGMGGLHRAVKSARCSK